MLWIINRRWWLWWNDATSFCIDGTFVDDGLLVANDDDIIGDTAVDGGNAVDDTANTDTRDTADADDMKLERRDININEDRMVDKFLNKGCGCRLFNGKLCSTAFTRQHICSICDQCTLFDCFTLLLGHVMATVRTSEIVQLRGRPNKEEQIKFSSWRHYGTL